MSSAVESRRCNTALRLETAMARYPSQAAQASSIQGEEVDWYNIGGRRLQGLSWFSVAQLVVKWESTRWTYPDRGRGHVLCLGLWEEVVGRSQRATTGDERLGGHDRGRLSLIPRAGAARRLELAAGGGRSARRTVRLSRAGPALPGMYLSGPGSEAGSVPTMVVWRQEDSCLRNTSRSSVAAACCLMRAV